VSTALIMVARDFEAGRGNGGEIRSLYKEAEKKK
jgi:hydroxyethylthiazole kinase-like sugar kinase family protein